MSFLSVLKKFGGAVAGVEHIAAPILAIAIPAAAPFLNGFDALTTKIQQTVVAVEASHPVGTPGSIKADAFNAEINSFLEVAQSAADIAGQTLTFDQAELDAARDTYVSALNHSAKLKASFKLAPKVSG